MKKTKQQEQEEQLSRTAAMVFTLARAFNLWNQRMESISKQMRLVHTQESKMALSTILDGTKKIETGLRHFENWALDAGVTESGHSGDAVALDAYLTDGAWLAYLAGATFNATRYDNMIRLTIESLCKNKTTGKPLIDWDVLSSLRPQ